MLFDQFSASTALETSEENVWPPRRSLTLPDTTQAISNLAGIAYDYNPQSALTSSPCTEQVDFANRGQLDSYDAQHPGMPSLHYEYDEGYLPEQYLEIPPHAGDDDDYYANGFLLTYQFPKNISAIDVTNQYPPQPMILPLIPDSQEAFPNSATLLPFPSDPVDDPIDDPGSYPKINHDFLLPNQYSTYSELSANLAYMATQPTRYEEAPVISQKQGAAKRRTREKATTRVTQADKYPKRDDPNVPLLTESSHTRRKARSKGAHHRGSELIGAARCQTSPPMPEGRPTSEGSIMKHIPPPSGVGRTSTRTADRQLTKRKLGLACLFCRERKIACGRPSESNPDQTCNQCARRCFICEYPIESRRGQHKRSKSKRDVT